MAEIFPITQAEADALHSLGWSSGFGWRDKYDWYHAPSFGPDVWVEDDSALMTKFLSDLEGFRASEAARVREERLHANSEAMYGALDEIKSLLCAGSMDGADQVKRSVNINQAWWAAENVLRKIDAQITEATKALEQEGG